MVKKTAKKRAKKKVSKRGERVTITTKVPGPEYSSFVFIGDPRGGANPEQITMFGYTFVLNGTPVEVRNPQAAQKLSGNSHFM